MLNKKEIEKLIKGKKLIENYISLEKQLTPNGIDLTVAKISRFLEAGSLDFSNKERVIPKTEEVTPDKKNP
jgi:deoxycytidine triphosphate deaminase